MRQKTERGYVQRGFESARVTGCRKCLSHMPWHAPSHVRRRQATHIRCSTTHYHLRSAKCYAWFATS